MVPWILSATGDIIDSEDQGLIATLEETVSEEDSLVMAASRELYNALDKLLDRCTRAVASGEIHAVDVQPEIDQATAAIEQARGMV